MNVSAEIRAPIGDPLLVGSGRPVRVMALIGSTSRADVVNEPTKIDAIAQAPGRPDLVADLSLRRSNPPLWRRVIDAGFPAATLPIYMVDRRRRCIDAKELLDIALEQIADGVGMLTIHPTARKDVISLAQKRRVPLTSRGGALVVRDLQCGRKENVYLEVLPDIASAARIHGVTLSLGATFRSAVISDADDDAQRAEIRIQADIAKSLKSLGCSVVVEGPGHAAPDAIRRLATRMKECYCPIMPLGPIPTDLAVGQDHISAAIGATLMGLEDAAHILAAVTREEHTGGVPKIASTLEAIDAARVAARVIDLARFGISADEEQVEHHRATFRTCVHDRRKRGCGRCGNACPL